MKVITPLLSVLILGSMSVLGSSEHPSNELAQRAVCMVGCKVPYPVGECWNMCNSEPREIPVRDVEAEASDILVCIGSSNEPVLTQDKGFMTEIRNQTSDWDDTSTMHVIGSPYWSYGELPPGRYEIRFTRVFPKGISRSEIKGFTVPEPDGKPTRNLDMWVECVANYNHDGSFMVDIGFKPVVENPYCTYWMRCKQDGGNYSEAKIIQFEGVGIKLKIHDFDGMGM